MLLKFLILIVLLPAIAWCYSYKIGTDHIWEEDFYIIKGVKIPTTLHLDFHQYVELLFHYEVSKFKYIYKMTFSDSPEKNYKNFLLYENNEIQTTFKRVLTNSENIKIKIHIDKDKILLFNENNTLIFSVLNSTKVEQIKNVAVKTDNQGSIVYDDIYTFLASTDKVCYRQHHIPLLSCNLAILKESLFHTAEVQSEGVRMKLFSTHLFKSSSTKDNYHIRIFLHPSEKDPYISDIFSHEETETNTNKTPPAIYSSYFTIDRNQLPVLKVPGHYYLNTRLLFEINFVDAFVYLKNQNPSLIWHKQDTQYHFELFDRIFLQNMNNRASDFVSINNDNDCRVECINTKDKGFISKIGTFFFKSKLSLDKYCNQTLFDKLHHHK